MWKYPLIFIIFLLTYIIVFCIHIHYRLLHPHTLSSSASTHSAQIYPQTINSHQPKSNTYTHPSERKHKSHLTTPCPQLILPMLPAAVTHQHHKVDHQRHSLEQSETEQLEQLIRPIHFIPNMQDQASHIQTLSSITSYLPTQCSPMVRKV